MADSQLRKGVLELIVLASLSRAPAYDGALLQRLENAGMAVSAGTLYPLLNRLKKAGHLAIHWEESPAGPPRKIYTITAAGRSYGERLAGEWRNLAAVVTSHLTALTTDRGDNNAGA
ncbi:MAG: PadR family transcriptional regulator [Schaalia turicensis]